MKKTVIDTNCLVGFFRSLLSDNADDYRKAVDKAMQRGIIAIDDKGHAIHEYDEACRPKAASIGLKDWVYERIREKKVLEFAMDRSEEKNLKNNFGLPKKDCKWVSIALGASGNVIVTEDIDLFDPKKKNLSGEHREKVMEWNIGALSKHLKKKKGIFVVRCNQTCALCEEID